MFPLRDHNPANRVPFVNYALIAVNVVVFLSYVTLFSNPQALGAFFDTWAMVPAEVMSGSGWHGILTSMFLHGGWMHLIGNMLFLYIFGDNLEDVLGHVAYLGFYLLSGAGAAALQLLADPSSQVPMVGASGAIAGVMGGYLLMFPKARIDVLFFFVILIRIVPVPAWGMLGVWFGFQVFNGFTRMSDLGGVAYWAHVGGFLVGLAVMGPVWMSRGGPRFWQRTHGHPDHPPARYRRAAPLASSSTSKTVWPGRSRVPTVRRKR